MSLHIPYLLSASLISLSTLQAATVLSQSYMVNTTVEGVLDSDNSSTLDIESFQNLPYNGNSSSQIRAEASDLIASQPQGADSFAYNGSQIASVDSNVIIESTALRGKVTAAADASHSISFSLGAGETKRVNFYLDYLIDIANGNQNSASVSWLLAGPGANTLLQDSRTLTTPLIEPATLGTSTTDDSDSGLLTAIINQAGTYTLTVTANIPEQDFANANRAVDVQIQQLDFEVVNVPEPSSSILIALASSALLSRRRRG